MTFDCFSAICFVVSLFMIPGFSPEYLRPLELYWCISIHYRASYVFKNISISPICYVGVVNNS